MTERFVFGAGADRWAFSDPCSAAAVEAQRWARYGSAAGNRPELTLAELASALAYLVYDCPSTKLAQQKLAQVRAAARRKERVR